ncbi:hypothetical protein LCGC14_2215130, partial [marine sediment metagenome]
MPWTKNAAPAIDDSICSPYIDALASIRRTAVNGMSPRAKVT